MVDQEYLLALLHEMIRIDSVNPGLVPGGAGESGIARFIGSCLSSAGFKVKYQEFGENRVNVIGILKGSGGGRNLMLNGHTDTVGLGGMIDPLVPRTSEGRVYGRGSLDMKGGIAAMIGAGAAVARSGHALKGDLLVACVGDEEYMSQGTEALVREFTAEGAIVCEPTGLDVVLAHKGFAWLRVDITGKAAHGSLPDEGIDAISMAGRLLVAVEHMASTTLARKNHPLLGSPSIHASFISGGSELSTYPGSCRVDMERRTVPGEDMGTVKAEMNEIISGLGTEDPRFEAAWKILFHRSPFEVCREEPVVKTLVHSCRSVFGCEPGFAGTGAWLDSAILKEAGIPTVVFGPDGRGAHSDAEYVEFGSVLAVARVLGDVIVRYCS